MLILRWFYDDFMMNLCWFYDEFVLILWWIDVDFMRLCGPHYLLQKWSCWMSIDARKCVCRAAACDRLGVSRATFLYSRFEHSMFSNVRFAASWHPLRLPPKHWGGVRGKGQRLVNVVPFSTQMGHIGAICGEMIIYAINGEIVAIIFRRLLRLANIVSLWVGTPPHHG